LVHRGDAEARRKFPEQARNPDTGGYVAEKIKKIIVFKRAEALGETGI
jgi:nucleoid DNA-binding protein